MAQDTYLSLARGWWRFIWCLNSWCRRFPTLRRLGSWIQRWLRFWVPFYRAWCQKRIRTKACRRCDHQFLPAEWHYRFCPSCYHFQSQDHRAYKAKEYRVLTCVEENGTARFPEAQPLAVAEVVFLRLRQAADWFDLGWDTLLEHRWMRPELHDDGGRHLARVLEIIQHTKPYGIFRWDAAQREAFRMALQARCIDLLEAAEHLRSYERNASRRQKREWFAADVTAAARALTAGVVAYAQVVGTSAMAAGHYLLGWTQQDTHNAVAALAERDPEIDTVWSHRQDTGRYGRYAFIEAVDFAVWECLVSMDFWALRDFA